MAAMGGGAALSGTALLKGGSRFPCAAVHAMAVTAIAPHQLRKVNWRVVREHVSCKARSANRAGVWEKLGKPYPPPLPPIWRGMCVDRFFGLAAQKNRHRPPQAPPPHAH